MDTLLDNCWILDGFIGDYFSVSGPHIAWEKSISRTSSLLFVRPDTGIPMENFPVPSNLHQEDQMTGFLGKPYLTKICSQINP
jgi:hypothetical protein